MLIEADTVNLSDAGDAGVYKLVSGEANIVRAWNISVRGSVTARGQDVTLIANEVVFEDGAVIDTSGNDGSPNWPPGTPPTTQVAPGAKGTDGAPGGPGANAGNILIVCTKITGTVTVNAKGGAGGRGQDGGGGGPGQDYNGPTPTLQLAPNQPLPNPPAHGLPGSQGAQAGQAGAHGQNGNGGNLVISTTGELEPERIKYTLSGGSDLRAAVPGNPGQGGKGSPAPVYLRLPYYNTVGRGTEGPKGPSGPPADPTSPPKEGKDGVVKVLPLTNAIMAKRCSIEQVRRVLEVAESLYINDKPEEAVDRLIWVSALAALMPSNSHA